jgi:hypothetical protein
MQGNDDSFVCVFVCVHVICCLLTLVDSSSGFDQ